MAIRNFVREYLAAFRRMGRDSRARTIVARGTYLLLIGPLSTLWFLSQAVNEAGSQALILDAAIAALAYFIFRLLRRSHRQQDELLNYSLTGQLIPDAPSHQVAEPVRLALLDRLHIASAFCARASSAQARPTEAMNSFLQQHGLWEKLEPAERELATLPDVEWPADRILVWAEQVRLLRWVFRLDEELIPLERFPSLHSPPSADLVQAPQPSTLRPPWDLRHESNIANGYYPEVVAELGLRNLLNTEGIPRAWYERQRGGAGPSTDLLAGSLTIGELSNQDLAAFRVTIDARREYAAYLADQLDEASYIPFSRWQARPLDLGWGTSINHGMIAARMAPADFLHVLSEAGIKLAFQRRLAPEDQLPEDRLHNYLLLGEHGGSTYAMEPSMLISINPDVLAYLASRGQTQVVGCGMESRSGTYGFSHFDGDRVMRRFFACHADLSVPFSAGDPLASEDTQPLDDDEGIMAALEETGFPYYSGCDELYCIEELIELSERPLDREEQEHYERQRSRN